MAVSRLLGGLLLGSLILNLFLGGILIGRVQLRHETGGESIAERIIERMASTLPEDDGKILRTVFHARQASIGSLTADLEKAHDEVRRVLRAEPLDQQALQTAFAAVRLRRQALHGAVHEVVIEAAPQLSPQGRRKLAEWRKVGR